MRTQLFVLTGLLVSACASVSGAADTKQLCTQTVRDYTVLRDEGPAEDYTDLFTADGEFHLGPNITKGRDALIARHISANTNARWRHHMTDIRINTENEKITGRSRFHIFTGPLTEKASAPSREIIGTYIDGFVIDDGMCKIKTRKVDITFDTLN